MRKRTVIGAGLFALVLAGGSAGTANAAAAPVHHWGPVQSTAGHGGYAKADVWLSDFDSERFTVSGTLYDRDRHSGHCGYVRARFHYVSGGTGWAQGRYTCSSRGGTFKLSSDGEVDRVDVRVCVLNRKRNTLHNCHTDVIKASTVANWPQ
ncbi:hypothetical protein PS9374_03589 [Planomonospora sphaerica]|uniref:Secreted protein n=1 Tax=Planomonospora sphaerica TaxID=161355 RepID=A0A171DBM9_9ACTN|nr:hypothetical protein [Planomonospora sphaerica]GAT67929.1 hypothetical protein PS9374_03589 [Planomonospora sphaerica]